jgi:hypothetical protein
MDQECSVNYNVGDDIVTGSAEEDQEWYLNLLPYLLPYCPLGPQYSRGFPEHFWDPDKPNNSKVADYDNGYSDDTIVTGLTGIGQFSSAYRKAQDF